MGARHVGDIKEMCRLVHPEIGILTSVGPQHLDTFKTLERVTKTKYELIDALPDNGRCFFPDDEGICLELYRKTEKPKFLSGLNSQTDDVWAEDITVSPEGSRFILCTRDFQIPCRTALLGELNIRNILLCASVALSLGLTGEQIARGISRLTPVEHRLQLIPSSGGITIIDDAFNSNIQGAEQAFRVLKEFPPQRIIITPGMVELGRLEHEMNREFGEKMAAGCDTAILVGKKRSAAIREGLAKAGLPADAVNLIENTDRALVKELLTLRRYIDLAIPRGGAGLIRMVVDTATVPCIETGSGVCHVYVDKDADLDMAVHIVENAKVSRPSTCNAMETLLIHDEIAPRILPRLYSLLTSKKVTIRGDASVCRIIPCEPASEEDWSTEYLDYILSVRIVPSLHEAIDHINRFGSHHTDCIVTTNEQNASVFMKQVDSAGVYWNVSTRFADGFVYGLGAEVGIATGKLHARGPMGLEGLTTYKYKLIGSGQTMEDMKKGLRVYTHRKLNENCPL
jgi:hypothetical protein